MNRKIYCTILLFALLNFTATFANDFTPTGKFRIPLPETSCTEINKDLLSQLKENGYYVYFDYVKEDEVKFGLPWKKMQAGDCVEAGKREKARRAYLNRFDKDNYAPIYDFFLVPKNALTFFDSPKLQESHIDVMVGQGDLYQLMNLRSELQKDLHDQCLTINDPKTQSNCFEMIIIGPNENLRILAYDQNDIGLDFAYGHGHNNYYTPKIKVLSTGEVIDFYHPSDSSIASIFEKTCSHKEIAKENNSIVKIFWGERDGGAFRQLMSYYANTYDIDVSGKRFVAKDYSYSDIRSLKCDREFDLAVQQANEYLKLQGRKQTGVNTSDMQSTYRADEIVFLETDKYIDPRKNDFQDFEVGIEKADGSVVTPQNNLKEREFSMLAPEIEGYQDTLLSDSIPPNMYGVASPRTLPEAFWYLVVGVLGLAGILVFKRIQKNSSK